MRPEQLQAMRALFEELLHDYVEADTVVIQEYSGHDMAESAKTVANYRARFEAILAEVESALPDRCQRCIALNRARKPDEWPQERCDEGEIEQGGCPILRKALGMEAI